MAAEAQPCWVPLGASGRPAAAEVRDHSHDDANETSDRDRGHRATRREQDVAVLVARGMSNGQIAAALVISARTVEKHVQHIMNKLRVSTRAQIAAWSAARPPAPPPPGSGAPGS